MRRIFTYREKRHPLRPCILEPTRDTTLDELGALVGEDVVELLVQRTGMSRGLVLSRMARALPSADGAEVVTNKADALKSVPPFPCSSSRLEAI